MSESFLQDLTARLDRGGLLVDRDAMSPFLTDWRGLFHGDALAVVRPKTTEEVSACVALCARHGVAVVPQGGNSGLAAGATPLSLERAIVLNLSRMNALRAIDPSGFTASVDAGCVLSDVQAAAEKAGRFFPLSLAAEGSAQIGGLIATNAGGTAVLRYGSMRALVLGIEVVLADGRIADGMRSLRKDNAGYDWKQVFIGSEGTLGVITGAVLRLFSPQRTHLTALLSVRSLEDAMTAFAQAQEEFGDLLSAAELFPERAVELRRSQTPGLERPMPAAAWYLLIEAASSLAGLEDRLQSALLEVVERGSVSDCAIAQNAAQRDSLWEWRETITESERRAGPSAKHDVSVPVSGIPSFVARATSELERAFPACVVLPFGHAGDGNIHYNVILPRDGSVDATAVNALIHRIVAEYRGSITAEHGVGRYRRDELGSHRSDVEMALLHGLKNALDSQGLMNPGAVL